MFRLFSLAIVGMVLIYATESILMDKFITGKITYTGTNTFDNNAKIRIELQDSTLMDTPAKIISSIVVPSAKGFPVPYRLEYNPSDIVPGHVYSLSVKIMGLDGKLLFTNAIRTPVDLTSSTAPVVDIAVSGVEVSSNVDTMESSGKQVCPEVTCPNKPLACPYGYQKKDGCEICQCDDPCNPLGKPILCESDERCFVEKNVDGLFEGRCRAESSKVDKRGLKDPKIICTLPKVVGKCRGSHLRYYYDAHSKTCKSFKYGGCGDNGNNFKTILQCETTCKPKGRVF